MSATGGSSAYFLSHDHYTDADWVEVDRSAPCDICGHDTWCVVSPSGVRICRRASASSTGELGQERHDKDGLLFWLFPPNRAGYAPRPTPIPRAERPAQIQRADIRDLDRVYRALLEACMLSAEHREALRQRGLTDDEIAFRGYRSMPMGPKRTSVLRHLESLFSVDLLLTVPGIYADAKTHRLRLAGAAGIMIPSRDIVARIQAVLVRADNPSGAKYVYMSSSGKTWQGHARGGPSAISSVHVPMYRGTQEHLDAIGITEGVLKADVATAISGRRVLGSPGLAWQTAIPVIEAMKPSRIILAFDSDKATNEHVRRAEQEAGRDLISLGYQVEVATWQEPHKGVDDALAAGCALTLTIASGGKPIQVVELNEIADAWSTDPVVTTDKHHIRCDRLIRAYVKPNGIPAKQRAYCDRLACIECGPKRVRKILEWLLPRIHAGARFYVGTTIDDPSQHTRIRVNAYRLNAESESAVGFMWVRKDTLSDDFLYRTLTYISTHDLGGGWPSMGPLELFTYIRDTLLILPFQEGTRIRLCGDWTYDEPEREKEPSPGHIGVVTTARLSGAYREALQSTNRKFGASYLPDQEIHVAEHRIHLIALLKEFARDPARKYDPKEDGLDW